MFLIRPVDAYESSECGSWLTDSTSDIMTSPPAATELQKLALLPANSLQ
jgi:hypothetical protein